MRYLILILLFASFAAVPEALSQDVWLSLHGGYSAPMSQELAEGFHAGYNAGGAVSAYLNPYVMAEFSAEQERFSAIAPGHVKAAGDFWITTGAASLRAYPFPYGTVVPYMKATLAIQHMKAPQETATYFGRRFPIKGSAQAAHAAGLGGGLEARIWPNGGLFAEAQYFIGYVGAPKMIHIPIRAGMFFRISR